MIRVLAVSLLGLVSPLQAQLPNLLGKDAPKQEAPVETPDQTKERLQGWLTDARAQLARLDDPAAETQLPQGVTTAEYAERRRDTQQTVASLELYLKNLAGLPDSVNDAKAARQARADWHGFKETPPFSVLKVDDLRNQRDVAEQRKASGESSLSLLERSLDEIRQQTDGADAGLRRALETATANDKDLAAKWRLEAAKLHQRMLNVRAASAAVYIDVQRNRLAAASDELSLLELQISTALPHQAFLKDDLANVKKSASDRQAALKKEIEALDKRRRVALANRRKLDPPAPANGKPAAIDEVLQLRMDAADARVESLQFSMDMLESLGQLETQTADAYDFRSTLMGSGDANTRAAALKSLNDITARVKPWGVYAEGQFQLAAAELRNQEARAASLAADDPKLDAIADQREAIGEKMAVVQRVTQNVDLAQRQISRWLADYDAVVSQQSWSQRGSSLLSAAGRGVRSVWEYEVFHIDSKGVTLGRLISALALFTAGYLIAARVTRRLQRMVVSRGRVAEAQAITLRRWLMVLLGFFLVVSTLQVMKIPLTIFAFFGGALAIGLGFGTQTLIKNFISGIIMLFERNIRVGDIVDVGGSVGTVSEINTRSSILRSVDGLETLVPNSMFLENKITNWTHSNRKLRRSIKIGVSYGSSSQQVAEILVECANRHGKVLKDPEPMALFEDFGDNALMFCLYFWVELAGNTNSAVVSSDLRFMIEKRLTESGIGIPFPQRDLRIVTDTPLQVEWAPKSGE